MTPNDNTRAKALKLLTRGLITMSDAAELASTSRQLVRYWCKCAGIDPAKRRAAYLRKLWRKG